MQPRFASAWVFALLLSVFSAARKTTARAENPSVASLFGMGSNASGQLGDGSTTSRTTPVLIAAASPVASASVGNAHSLLIKTIGSLWAMGYNFDGQLGDGSRTSRLPPVPITTGVASVSAGCSHALLAKTDGSRSADLVTWSPVALAPVVTNPDADGNGQVELVTVSVPLPAGANPRLFLRVSVSE